MKLTFEISNEAFELLKKIGDGEAEYRDTEWETLEDFKSSDVHLSMGRTEEWFLNRNFNGTYHLILELLEFGLVDHNYDSWHQTYIQTPFAKKVLYGK